jgi:hypothetical protein
MHCGQVLIVEVSLAPGGGRIVSVQSVVKVRAGPGREWAGARVDGPIRMRWCGPGPNTVRSDDQTVLEECCGMVGNVAA